MDLFVNEKRRLPAWALSATLHVVATVVLVLCVHGPTPRGVSEEARKVGIVLAHTQPGEQWSYPEPAEPETSTEPSGGQPATAGGQDGGDSAENRLPPAADSQDLMLPDIQLPGLTGSVGAPEELLSYDLELSGNTRRPFLPGENDVAILAEEAARKAAERALGPAARLSVFGSAAAEGRSFVFAIDRSKSMGGDGLNALAAARIELSRCLDPLAANHQFQILAYHHGCVYYKSPRLITAGKDAKAGVGDFIDGLVAFGGTDHEMALRAALGMEPDVVFLLTDGGDPYLNEIQLANIKKLASGRTTIHCIQFGFRASADPDNFMQRLAEQNRGGYTYVQMKGP